MHSELCIEVSEGIETVGIVEPALILPVATFDFPVMPRRIRPDQLVADPKFSSRSFKERNELSV